MTASSDPAAMLEAGGFLRSVAGEDFYRVVDAASVSKAGGRGLLLSGATGCGKTLAMRCLCPPSVPPLRVCRWIDCFSPVQVGWLDDADIWAWARTIVLDDLGAEPIVNNFGVQRFPVADFFMRLSRRIDSGEVAPNICVTTNLSSGEMADRYGERMMSRLLSVVVVQAMGGEDRRGLNPSDLLPPLGGGKEHSVVGSPNQKGDK